MGQNITEEQRKEFEAFIAAHPIPPDYDPDILDWAKTNEQRDIDMAYVLKMLLEKESKTPEDVL